jgi:hypothetical protein
MFEVVLFMGLWQTLQKAFRARALAMARMPSFWQ